MGAQTLAVPETTGQDLERTQSQRIKIIYFFYIILNWSRKSSNLVKENCHKAHIRTQCSDTLSSMHTGLK